MNIRISTLYSRVLIFIFLSQCPHYINKQWGYYKVVEREKAKKDLTATQFRTGVI